MRISSVMDKDSVMEVLDDVIWAVMHDEYCSLDDLVRHLDPRQKEYIYSYWRRFYYEADEEDDLFEYDGQPDDYTEQQDFAQDDDWRTWADEIDD